LCKNRSSAVAPYLTEITSILIISSIITALFPLISFVKGLMADWIGQFYAYFQWYYNISSKKVMELVPLDFIKAAYHGLHDLELELAVKKVGGQVAR